MARRPFQGWSESALRLVLILSSLLFSLALAVAGYEAYQNVLYYRWRAGFSSVYLNLSLAMPATHPGLIWEYRPYSFAELIYVNRYGFRDHDFVVKTKPAGTRRIAFIGDSVTLGLKMPVERTFVPLVEAKLRAQPKGSNLQALNFGIDGYDTSQVLANLRAKVWDFDPDLVVYVMCLNDFDDEEGDGGKRAYFVKPSLFTYRTLERMYIKWTGTDYSLFFYHKNKDKVLAEIDDMAAEVKAHGKRLLVVIVPTFYPAPSFADYPLRPIHTEVSAALTAHGIPSVDLLPPFEAAGKAPPHWAVDIWHLNIEGHKLVTDALVEPVLSAATAD